VGRNHISLLFVIVLVIQAIKFGQKERGHNVKNGVACIMKAKESFPKPPPNNSMDVRAKQRLCLERRPLNSNGLSGGFAPRHLNRYVSSCSVRFVP
jgi:hypothetical protein